MHSPRNDLAHPEQRQEPRQGLEAPPAGVLCDLVDKVREPRRGHDLSPENLQGFGLLHRQGGEFVAVDRVQRADQVLRRSARRFHFFPLLS